MAYKNLNILLIFIILIHLVNKVVNGQKFLPETRASHTATLLGGKIYYIGGFSLSAVDSAADFFYLDENFTWVDLKSQGVKFPLTYLHTSNIGDVNQDSIFIIEGTAKSLVNVYKFDTKTNAITEPVIRGITPPRRLALDSVSYRGKIYILGGMDYNTNIIVDRFDILDTINSNWEVGSLNNAPFPRFEYTATLVNGVIYYIGGIEQAATNQSQVPLSSIYQYDIIGNTWSLKTATAAKTLPGPRIGHSAVLVNGKICIYGGEYFPTNSLIPAAEQIAMLDTTTLVWSIPPLQDPNIPSLAYHTATLIDKLMLIAFGDIFLSGKKEYNDKFYLFDFGEPNIKWKSFTALEIGGAKALQSPTNSSKVPNTTKSTGTTSSTAKVEDSPQSSSPNQAVVIGLSVGLVAVGLAGIIGFALLYKRMKRMEKNENVAVERRSGHPSHPGVPGAFDGQIPPGDNLHYSIYSQQFAPQYQYSNLQDPYYSRISTLTQSQGYSPGQEHSSGNEPFPSNYSHRSETHPPPSPSKAPQPAFNVHGTNHEAYY